MKNLFTFALGLGTLGLLFLAPARGQDSIRYRDPKTGKRATAVGAIQEESPAHVVYQPTAGSAKEIPAAQILDVVYDLPGAVKLTYRSALSEERRATDPALKDEERAKALRGATESYQEVLGKLDKDKNKFALRQVHFKLALLLAGEAQTNADQVEAAIDALKKFKQAYPDGWQVVRAARLLAQLQLNRGDADAAEKTYQDLAATPGLPEATRQECDLLQAQAMIAGKKYDQARQKLEAALQSLPAEDPQAVRARIYLAEAQGAAGKLPEAVKEIEAIIGKTDDKDLKAVAYNALGDCYRLNGKNKDALWPYLWVDVIYHQNRQEHLKAMEQLARLFDEQGDRARARQYRERLAALGR